MRKFLALLAFSFAAVRGEAASVEWDNFTHVETEFDVQADSEQQEGQALLIDIMGTTRFQALPGLVDEIVL